MQFGALLVMIMLLWSCLWEGGHAKAVNTEFIKSRHSVLAKANHKSRKLSPMILTVRSRYVYCGLTHKGKPRRCYRNQNPNPN